MYTHNNNSNHPDPFAGQYPPPPPLKSPEAEQPPAATFYPEPSYPVYSAPPIIPQPQSDAYVPPPIANDYYERPSYNHHKLADEERQLQGVNDYHDPHGQSLDAYLRQEREQYLRQNQQQPTSYHNESFTSPITATASESPKPNQVIPLDSFTKEDYQDAEKTPMVQKKPSLSRKERKKLEKMQKNQQYEPYMAKPTLAPENEAETYKYRPQQEKRGGGCNCCCYNPAITCCSFFGLLISCAFAAAGIAMIIASKVVSDKCVNQCTNVADAAQSACNTLCSKVLHDGLFYGGIVVAGLAGIAVIWKLIMWTCAGYSKR